MVLSGCCVSGSLTRPWHLPVVAETSVPGLHPVTEKPRRTRTPPGCCHSPVFAVLYVVVLIADLFEQRRLARPATLRAGAWRIGVTIFRTFWVAAFLSGIITWAMRIYCINYSAK